MAVFFPGAASLLAVALPVAQPDPKGQVVIGPGGTAVRIPAGYVAQPAANERMNEVRRMQRGLHRQEQTRTVKHMRKVILAVP